MQQFFYFTCAASEAVANCGQHIRQWSNQSSPRHADMKSLVEVEGMLRQRARCTIASLLSILAQGVGVVKGSSFSQVAVDVIASHRQLSGAPSDQIVKDHVFIEHLERQNRTLRGGVVGELFVPPGVLVVVTDSGGAQRGGTTENLNVGVCNAKDIRGKTSGVQVMQFQLRVSRSQTAHEQQEEREMGGHGSSGCCGDGEQQM